jgi:hypothetical protein
VIEELLIAIKGRNFRDEGQEPSLVVLLANNYRDPGHATIGVRQERGMICGHGRIPGPLT